MILMTQEICSTRQYLLYMLHVHDQLFLIHSTPFLSQCNRMTRTIKRIHLYGLYVHVALGIPQRIGSTIQNSTYTVHLPLISFPLPNNGNVIIAMFESSRFIIKLKHTIPKYSLLFLLLPPYCTVPLHLKSSPWYTIFTDRYTFLHKCYS